MDVFGDSRYRYVYPPDGDGIFQAGGIVDEGEARIPWNAKTIEDPDRVRSLRLEPSKARLRDPRLPAYVKSLRKLESLVVPTPFVPLARDLEVRTLVVGHSHEYGIPASPVSINPGVRGLMWVTSVHPPSLAQVIDPLPPLEFLHVNISGKRAVEEQLRSLTTLRHLEVVDLRNREVPVRSPLRALELGGTGRDFPFGRVVGGIGTLEALRLNGVRADIDCAVLRTLPNLVDLTVLNSKRFVDLDALLDCPKLAKVTFVNCGDPFKKQGRARFAERGFAHLDIKFA
ncbi:hypothetical protein [Actinoplanes solisilvae]|uniref:hypothetical protein n=1 Tax=Actinoplanes solisilvae TaxID=2486853 RepID=UPI000FD7753C|nr:hypothetical protein [Actinoplanes solisilvae]